LGAVCGALLGLSFPHFGIPSLAWLAPGLILFSALGRSGGEAFSIGDVAGVFRNLISLYWLLLIPFPAGAIAGWLALSAYLSFFSGIWVWFLWWIYPKAGRDSSRAPVSGAGALFDDFLATMPAQRLVWALMAAATWVGLEIIQGRFLTGFPWNFLGASQYEMLPLIQMASVTGVYGISFLVAWFSVTLTSALIFLMRRPGARRAFLGELLPPVVVLMLVLLYGFHLIFQPQRIARTLKVALVQPSIPQTLIWDTNQNAVRFEQLMQLSEAALATKPDLLIWPEAAVPTLLRYDFSSDYANYRAITNMLSRHNAWMILGADDLEPRLETPEPNDADFFNSAFLLSPEGKFKGHYRKQRLVIFGEYVPLSHYLPFLQYLTPIEGGFTSGKEPVDFEIPSPKVKTSVLICFEDTFPHLTRQHVDSDTDFLVNLTNNGWFGESAAQWQHAANAVFRAVENGLPLVRCANNGLTCWVDRVGRLHEVYFGASRNIYGAGFKTAQIPLLPEKGVREPTIYNLHGDWFGWSCLAVSVLWGIAQRVSARNVSIRTIPFGQSDLPSSND
ncbi:MAG: apolipoprotein N-acyltransferase, partial [Verrucomicrobiota bacterium]